MDPGGQFEQPADNQNQAGVVTPQQERRRRGRPRKRHLPEEAPQQQQQMQPRESRANRRKSNQQVHHNQAGAPDLHQLPQLQEIRPIHPHQFDSTGQPMVQPNFAQQLAGVQPQLHAPQMNVKLEPGVLESEPAMAQRELRRLPENNVLFLPHGATADWTQWTDDQCLEWALMFVTNLSDRIWLQKGLNVAMLQILLAGGRAELDMPVTLFAKLKVNFNKVFNTNNGYQ